MADTDIVSQTAGKLVFEPTCITVISASADAKPELSDPVNTGMCEVVSGCPVFVTHDECGNVVECFYYNPDNPKEKIMADGLELAKANEAATPLTLETEIGHFAINGAFSGTVADVLTAALAANPPADMVAPDAQTFPAAAGNVCAYAVTAAACDTVYLTDPTDTSTAVTVGIDGTYFNGDKIRTDADDEFASVDLTAPVEQDAGLSRSIWCFKFKTEGTVNKAGVFTPNP